MKIYKTSDTYKKLIEEETHIEKYSGIKIISVIDLQESTKIKTQYGHEEGSKKLLKAINLFDKIIKDHDGKVIKTMGDGVLSIFDNPLNAIFCSIDILNLSLEIGIRAKSAITIGYVDIFKLGDRYDIIGEAVDRCFRISSFCLPNQILVDQAFIDTIRSHLKDYRNIIISSSFRRFLKGIGVIDLYEISTRDIGLKGYVYVDLKVHEEGRVPLEDKVHFVKYATEEVFEMGIGMRTFTGFFTQHRPAEFRNYIINLVKRGVDVHFLIMDPEWEGTSIYLKSIGEEQYINAIRNSIDILKQEYKRVLKEGLKGGKFHVYLYRVFPVMHILCVDPKQESGRMFASPYLYGYKRSENPVFEFSRLSYPELFDKYYNNILNVIDKSKKII